MRAIQYVLAIIRTIRQGAGARMPPRLPPSIWFWTRHNQAQLIGAAFLPTLAMGRRSLAGEDFPRALDAHARAGQHRLPDAGKLGRQHGHAALRQNDHVALGLGFPDEGQNPCNEAGVDDVDFLH